MKRFLALFLVICMMLVPTISFADSSTVTLESIPGMNLERLRGNHLMA